MNKNILIIGYGDIGNRLSKILKEQSANIYAVSRHGSLDQNIIKINWDWLSNSNLDLPKITFDSVIIIPKPSNLDENGYRDGFISSLENITNSLQNVDIKSVIAISSTRVYGDHQVFNLGSSIFVNLLKLLIVPLVFFSLVSGISSLTSMQSLGNITFKTIALYLSTTAIAVSLSLIVGSIFKPGSGYSSEIAPPDKLQS